MTTILITGMSGTGKSTVLHELAGRGYRVVDLDDGWSAEVATSDGSGVEQLWLEDRVAGLLASLADAQHFVAGCASNQGAVLRPFRRGRTSQRPCRCPP